MQKIVLFFLTVGVMMASCAKSTKPALRYKVTNDAADSIFENIFIPDTGTYTMNIKVDFLSGYPTDNVKLVLTGLPANVTATPDTFSGVPNFTESFVFTSKNAVQGTYPVTLTGYTSTVIPQVYNFSVTVIPADCAALYWGSLTGTSACTSRSYISPATGVSTGVLNNLTINNFGGYGLHCNVTVVLNCDNDSLHIPLADYGNGVHLSGAGIFNADSMVIWYYAPATPTGSPESCTLTYKK